MIYDRPINIMLIDDHKMILKGLRGLLETQIAFRVVAEAAGGEEALHKVNELHKANGKEAIHLVVTDLTMRRGTISGIQLIKKLLADFPTLRILVYTMHDEEAHILQAIKAGAWGYVTKDEDTAVDTVAVDPVIEAIHRIVKGQRVFPPVLKPEERLTPTEQQVLWLLGNGKSKAYIAAELGITNRTVEKHRSNIWDKLKEYLSEEDGKNPTILINIATRYRDRCPYPDRGGDEG